VNATIIHGGQTGVDRGAWLGAREAKLPVDGFAPRDLRDERGPIPADVVANMRTSEGSFATRTRENVYLSHGVVLVAKDRRVSTPGTRLTHRLAQKREWVIVDGAHEHNEWMLRAFIARLHKATGGTRIMIAGPRASRWTGGEQRAREVVLWLAAA
jgi:hypothetical protein